MMDSSHLFNIQGCLGTYRDLESARSWFIRAKKELHDDEFMHLVQSIHRWLLHDAPDQNLLEKSTQLLSEFDPSGDAERQAEIERTTQQCLDKRRTQIESERKRTLGAEKDRLARICARRYLTNLKSCYSAAVLTCPGASSDE